MVKEKEKEEEPHTHIHGRKWRSKLEKKSFKVGEMTIAIGWRQESNFFSLEP